MRRWLHALPQLESKLCDSMHSEVISVYHETYILYADTSWLAEEEILPFLQLHLCQNLFRFQRLVSVHRTLGLQLAVVLYII